MALSLWLEPQNEKLSFYLNLTQKNQHNLYFNIFQGTDTDNKNAVWICCFHWQMN